jgi:hypothetical protein
MHAASAGRRSGDGLLLHGSFAALHLELGYFLGDALSFEFGVRLNLWALILRGVFLKLARIVLVIHLSQCELGLACIEHFLTKL